MKKIAIFILTLGLVLKTYSQTTGIEVILPDSNLVFLQDTSYKVIFGKNFKHRIQGKAGKVIETNPRSEYVKGKKITHKPYVPTPEEVSIINNKLRAFLTTVPDSLESVTSSKKKFIIDNYANYIFQFLGYINSKGQTIIYINCLLNDKDIENVEWKKNLINIYDGGPRYFNINYNKTKNQFTDLYINGSA